MIGFLWAASMVVAVCLLWPAGRRIGLERHALRVLTVWTLMGNAAVTSLMDALW
jgi:uncharacterized membrane protein